MYDIECIQSKKAQRIIRHKRTVEYFDHTQKVLFKPGWIYI